MIVRVAHLRIIHLAAAVLFLSGGAAVAAGLPAGVPPSAILLLRYDSNHDNVVTKEEMEAGLKADYAAADTNHDGCLDRIEVRAENARRLQQDGGQASPLRDWNLDGCVDMAEFSDTVRSYFGFVELRGPSMPLPVPGDNKDNKDNNGRPPPVDQDPGISY
jgi:hypothetical protein